MSIVISGQPYADWLTESLGYLEDRGIQKLALLGIDVSITYDSAAEEPETEQKPEEVPDTPAEIAVGSTVKIKAGATYTNGVKVPDSVTGKNLYDPAG